MTTRRRLTIALLATAAMFGLALPPLVGSQEQRRVNRIDRCADNGGRTLAANRSVRLYIARDRLDNEYLRSCWVPSGLTRTLRSSGARVLDLVPQLRIAGRYVGSSDVEFDTRAPIDPGVVLTVAVRDAKRFSCVTGFGAQPPDSGAASVYDDRVPGVTDLELSSEGAFAWIVSGAPNRDDYFHVQKVDAGGQAVLDEGAAIDPRSLAVAGDRIYWMNGGEARSALLQGPVARSRLCVAER